MDVNGAERAEPTLIPDAKELQLTKIDTGEDFLLALSGLGNVYSYGKKFQLIEFPLDTKVVDISAGYQNFRLG